MAATGENQSRFKGIVHTSSINIYTKTHEGLFKGLLDIFKKKKPLKRDFFIFIFLPN